MTGVTLTVKVDDREIIAALEKLQWRGRDASPALKAIGEYLLESHEQRFNEQLDPEGDPWEPLSTRYQKRKKKHKDLILVLDDYLKDTLRYQSGDNKLEFGTDRIYGATHQFGDSKRNIPERPFLGLSDTDKTKILAILRDYYDLTP